MPKIETKKQVVKEIEQKLQDAMLVVFTDYRGINVDQMTELRNRLRAPGIEYKVLKNTLTEFALTNTGHSDIIPYIAGPNAVIFSNEDPVGPSKVIYDFIKQYKKLDVKVAILQGQILSADKVKSLADLPPRDALLAQVLGTMQAPISSFVRVLNANISGLARVLDQIREQKAS